MTAAKDEVVETAITSKLPTGSVDLYWTPLGAGAHVVRISGKLFEAVSALAQGEDVATCTTRPSWSTFPRAVL